MNAPNISRTSSESELIAGILAGDSDLFERLIEPYSKGLLSTIRRRVGNQADADDIYQESLVKAFTKLQQFRGNALFGTWLHRIAVNEVSQHFRRRRGQTEPLSDHERELASKGPHALALFEQESQRMAVDRTLARMPEKDRQALVLFHVKELSLSETARELSIDCNALKARLSRARTRLQKVWRTTAFSDRYFVPAARPTAA